MINWELYKDPDIEVVSEEESFKLLKLIDTNIYFLAATTKGRDKSLLPDVKSFKFFEYNSKFEISFNDGTLDNEQEFIFFDPEAELNLDEIYTIVEIIRFAYSSLQLNSLLDASNLLADYFKYNVKESTKIITNLLGELVFLMKHKNGLLDSLRSHVNNNADIDFDFKKFQIKIYSAFSQNKLFKIKEFKTSKISSEVVGCVTLYQKTNGLTLRDIFEKINSKLIQSSNEEFILKKLSNIDNKIKILENTSKINRFKIDLDKSNVYFYLQDDFPKIYNTNPAIKNISYDVDIKALPEKTFEEITKLYE